MGSNFILKFQDVYIELVLSGGEPVDRGTAEQLWSTMENLGMKLGYNRFLLCAATSDAKPCNPDRIDCRSGSTGSVKVACVNVDQAVLAGFIDDAAICNHAVTGFFNDRGKALAWLTPAKPAERNVPARIHPAGGKYIH